MNNIKILIKNNVRIYLSDFSEVVQKNIEVQKTKPFPSLILAHSIAAFGVLPFMLQTKEGRVTAYIKSNGAVKNILVEAKSSGEIRALLGDSDIETEKDDQNFDDIPLILGIGNEGTLKISREMGRSGTFGGEVELMKSDIITDLAYYFEVSEQIYTAIKTSVKFLNKEKVKRAYSVIFQLIPGYTEEDIVWIENFLKENNFDELGIEEYQKRLDATLVGQRSAFWKCSCDREKILVSLKALPKEEINKMLEEDQKIEVSCHFCLTKYTFYKEDFKE
ncbi:Hsp33 family molecular chaperone HslO [Mycoplasma procyoni]|uniref:Hsp33 family molecular chaperone HslO n=1 Tax=Mycoplasma procyoni TaxID=568784 RepID=UPI00197B751E|nr:Hsp33 family molecular chaperone HslO [Mycoplasma procyoni]MBN3534871.1 Hsp33 family molecular chaperone HslO [Mycoplasma procyoni]